MPTTKLPSELEDFTDCVRGLGECTIDQVIARLDTLQFWKDDFFVDALERAKRMKARQLIRRVRDADGAPLWHNLAVKVEDGPTRHVYKQESLFTLDDYLQVFTHAAVRAVYWTKETVRLRDAVQTRYGTQLPLPWEAN